MNKTLKRKATPWSYSKHCETAPAVSAEDRQLTDEMKVELSVQTFDVLSEHGEALARLEQGRYHIMDRTQGVFVRTDGKVEGTILFESRLGGLTGRFERQGDEMVLITRVGRFKLRKLC
ncbi:hypothetical protein ISF12_11005 [Pseudomonas aeruginosa]|nr:hypothetical protein [Pseudomonas aeruginosa]